MFKLALLSADINSQAQYAAHLNNDDLEQLSARVEAWYKGLPKALHLRELVSENSRDSVIAERPLLFMHMVHITSRITLYERILQAALNKRTCSSDQSIFKQAFGLSGDTHEIYASFAQQLTRLIGLLYEKQCVLGRCPITM